MLNTRHTKSVFLLMLLLGAFCGHTQNWQLVFQDEFSDTAINEYIWEVSDNDQGAFPLFIDDNVNINNGVLELWAEDIRDNPISRATAFECDNVLYPDFLYTGSKVITWQDFKHGKFEFRAKMPLGYGLWPALWLHDRNFNNVMCIQDGNPTYDYGEIDIELAGGIPRLMTSTIHWTKNNNGEPDDDCSEDQDKRDKNYFASNNNIGQWHVYTIEWEENSVIVKVDNQTFKSFTHDFTMGMKIWLNLGIGCQHSATGFTQGPPHGNGCYDPFLQPCQCFTAGCTLNDAEFPVKMEVDWVRVYKRSNCDNDVTSCEYHSNATHPSYVLGRNITYGGGNCSTAVVYPFGQGWGANPQLSNSLELIASEAVYLKPGFKAYYESRFKARIEECSASEESDGKIPGDETGESTGPEAVLFDIFPNPNTGLFTIELEHLPTSCRLEIFDILGQPVWQQAIRQQVTSMDLNTLAKGSYLVKITTSEGMSQQKMIID